MSNVLARPLLTFGLCAYQQERFIREAVEGAFAQTYAPLQIILSDDCSADRTYEIMEEMAKTYKGPHRIVLNRNEPNCGLGEHINRVMELCEGELMVIAAGDDVSLPHRVEALWARWQTAGRPVGSIFSDAIEMAEDGAPIGYSTVPRSESVSLERILKGERGPVIGCAHAWHRKVFEVFGPLRAGVVNEDGAIFCRSTLLGSVRHIHEPLVRHRIHGANTGAGGRSEAVTAEGLRRFWKASFTRDIALFENLLEDLRHFASLGPGPENIPLRAREVNQILKFSRMARIFVSVGVFQRMFMLLPLMLTSRRKGSSRAILTQCLFPNVYLMFRSLRVRLSPSSGTPKV